MAFFHLDRGGRVTAVRGAGLRLLGLAPEDVVGRAALDFCRDDPSRERVRRALAGERLQTRVELEGRIVDLHFAPAAGPDGAPTGVFGIAVDVTNATRADEALRRAHGLEGLAIVAGGVAHDLNNLLATVLGNAALALLDAAADPRLTVLVRRVELAARRAGELTRQLLDFTTPDRASPERVDVGAVVRDMAALLESTVGKATRLDMRTEGDVPLVEADPTQLRQVLLNLVVNASEALGGRAGTVTILTGVRRVLGAPPRATTRVGDLPLGSYVALEVVDSGVGLDAATRSRIFEPFFSTKRSGRGLGLAVVLSVARRHGGAVEVESQPGRGSTFRLLLPASDAGPVGEPAAPSPDAAWQGAGRVLVVDDEPDVLEMLGELLERLGFTPVATSSADAAITRLRAEPDGFAAVLVDLTMPERSGLEVLAEAAVLAPDTPAVLMSGHDPREVRRRVGTDTDVLTKPFTLESLAERLRRALEKAR